MCPLARKRRDRLDSAAACVRAYHVCPERKKKRSILSTVVELPVVQNRRAAERANEGASTSALARWREWEIRRYKTDLVDWYQPVQRPDAATALVARVRERRSRCSACSLKINRARRRTQVRGARTHMRH